MPFCLLQQDRAKHEDWCRYPSRRYDDIRVLGLYMSLDSSDEWRYCVLLPRPLTGSRYTLELGSADVFSLETARQRAYEELALACVGVPESASSALAELLELHRRDPLEDRGIQFDRIDAHRGTLVLARNIGMTVIYNYVADPAPTWLGTEPDAIQLLPTYEAGSHGPLIWSRHIEQAAEHAQRLSIRSTMARPASR